LIAGIGVDRIAIKRVEAAIERHGERFITRLFTTEEIAQARAKGNPARRFAMLFAAKEAVSKALGTGLRQGVTLQSIETIIRLLGNLQSRCMVELSPSLMDCIFTQYIFH